MNTDKQATGFVLICVYLRSSAAKMPGLVVPDPDRTGFGGNQVPTRAHQREAVEGIPWNAGVERTPRRAMISSVQFL